MLIAGVQNPHVHDSIHHGGGGSNHHDRGGGGACYSIRFRDNVPLTYLPPWIFQDQIRRSLEVNLCQLRHKINEVKTRGITFGVA